MAQEAQCIPEMLSEQLASGDLTMEHIHSAVEGVSPRFGNGEINYNSLIEGESFFNFQIGDDKFFQTICGVSAGKDELDWLADGDR